MFIVLKPRRKIKKEERERQVIIFNFPIIIIIQSGVQKLKSLKCNQRDKKQETFKGIIAKIGQFIATTRTKKLTKKIFFSLLNQVRI